MNSTTEKVFEKTLYFPTVCVGVGQGKGCKTLVVDIRLETQLCRDWETLEERRMYVLADILLVIVRVIQICSSCVERATKILRSMQ